ncbi:MAG: lysophospholipid acyltransferase family protein [Candidatus Omnitrophota bacterium]
MCYRISRLIFKFLLIALFRVRFLGRENLPEAPYILVPNHISHLDPPLVGIADNKHVVDFMAKKELFRPSILGAWCKSVGCIPVERNGGATKAMREALHRLSRGGVIGIFPEGQRSANGDLQEAKRGIGFIIARAKVPVVPVYVGGSGKALPKGGKIHPGAKIDVIIGKPIAPEEFASLGRERDYEAISSEVMSHIAGLKEKWENC